jgi:L-aspartate oxidase
LRLIGVGRKVFILDIDYRYLVDFDTRDIKNEYSDVIILGSGIAGVYLALQISEKFNVTVITKKGIDLNNSILAQGGIAVSLNVGDSPQIHFNDTIYAGAGLCSEESVWALVNEAAFNIDQIRNMGVIFDKNDKDEISFTREGAHSLDRIIHMGDMTGKEVCNKLYEVLKTRSNIKFIENTFAIDILTEDNECKGVLTYDESLKCYKSYFSKIVVCATGGGGQIYDNTTNAVVATGDGTAFAYRAGVELMDLEFVQFHPTVLYAAENMSFLISEAVRGDGAILKNTKGERFMPKYHNLCELAPRDVVSRAIFREMHITGSEYVYLDITFKDKDYLRNRFPNINKTCLNFGIDITKDYIPVYPAEHYCMGGIRTDVNGKTNIKNFFSCGEVACNGTHGANRLASNSLLEGLVFGHRISIEIDKILKGQQKDNDRDVVFKYNAQRKFEEIDKKEIKSQIKKTMKDYVGIIRNREGLLHAKEEIAKYYKKIKDIKNQSIEDFELQNIVLMAQLSIDSALKREESRGAHYRSDFTETDDINWKKNIITQRKQLG